MRNNDPLAPLAQEESVAAAMAAAVEAINRAHRRPAGLRKPEIISSESLLRGARLGAPQQKVSEGPEISAYSLLAPQLQAATVRTFARAPLQILARIDVALGGSGLPADAARCQALARFITQGAGVAFDRLAPAIVQAEISAGELFGPRSEVASRVAARAMAIHTGLDPRGFAVPEVYLSRHAARHRQAVEGYRKGELVALIEFLLRAWEAGGEEADGIARAA